MGFTTRDLRSIDLGGLAFRVISVLKVYIGPRFTEAQDGRGGRGAEIKVLICLHATAVNTNKFRFVRSERRACCIHRDRTFPDVVRSIVLHWF